MTNKCVYFYILFLTISQAAQALWITILRFCGDLPEPRFVNGDRDNSSVMQRVQATLGRSFAQTSQFKELMGSNMDPLTPNSVKIFTKAFFQFKLKNRRN